MAEPLRKKYAGHPKTVAAPEVLPRMSCRSAKNGIRLATKKAARSELRVRAAQWTVAIGVLLSAVDGAIA